MTYQYDHDYLDPADSCDGSLLGVLDHLLDRGVLLWGELRISVADVDLIEVGLKLMLASPRTADRWRRTTAQRASGLPGDLPMNEQHLVGLLAIDTVPADLADDVIPCGAIAAAIRPVQTRGAGRDDLDHHAAVVAWCRRAAFLPSRAGIAISPRLLQSVTQSAGCYRNRLEHIVDRVEISVEFDRRADLLRRAAAGGGRAYLRAAGLDLRVCEVGIATAASLLAMFTERVDADLIVRTAPLPSVRLRAAVLVKRTAAPRLAQRIEATLNSISARLVCRVTGPWPPYSFSTIEESP